jgi:hypothetical protein
LLCPQGNDDDNALRELDFAWNHVGHPGPASDKGIDDHLCAPATLFEKKLGPSPDLSDRPAD